MGVYKTQQPETGIGVKKPNQVEYISKNEWEARIQTIAKSKRDIAWWAEQFFYIITLDKGLTKIQLYPKQREMLQFIADNSRIITLASRQTGKCVYKDTKIKIRNKKTGEISEITILDFFNLIANLGK